MGVPVALPSGSSAAAVDLAGLNARLVADPQSALDDALAAVAGYIGGPLETVTETVTLEATADQWLWLPFRRVQSVSSVQFGALALADGSWSLRGDALWRRCGWRSAGTNLWLPPTVTATVTHGFTTLPAELVAIVYALAQSTLQNPDGLRQFSVTQGDKSEGGTYAVETIGAGTLSPTQMATLDRYRLRRRTSVRMQAPR